MARLNVVIADDDKQYINRLVGYITEKNNNFNISCFTEKGSLLKYITGQTNKIHILIFSEKMYSEELRNNRIDLMLVLDNGIGCGLPGIKKINKYQSATEFINTILMEYSETTGDMSSIKNDMVETSRIIGVYSPVGGCGKTTIAIMLSKGIAAYGKKVLYLNYEGVSSVAQVFKGTGRHNMSEVFLAAKTRKANVALKVMQCKETDAESGIDFISSPECATEYGEMLPNELRRIVADIKTAEQYDFVVVDMNSGYNNDVIEVMEECDRLLIPFNKTDSAICKMNIFADEIRLNGRFDSIVGKMIGIENRCNSISIEGFGEITTGCCVPDSAVLRSINNLLYSSQEGIADSLVRLVL